MKRTPLFLLLLALLCAPDPASAQTPTWSDDVACIVYSHCATCHRPDGPGHVSLLTYAEAYPLRADIQNYTTIRYMPPWPPDQSYNRLAHERTLTQQEIDIIAAWADGGAPEGDISNAPPVPTFESNWAIPSPDVSVRMEEYVIPATTQDIYRCFVMPSGTTQDQYITGMEVIPGNTEVVHHVLVFQDTSGVGQQLDDADPAPGYNSFGSSGVDGAKLVGFWVPGAQAYFAPVGFGIRLLAGADLIMQVHYPEGSDFELDSTRLNLQLVPGSGLRPMDMDPVLEHFATLTDGPLIIPPNQVKTFHNQYTSFFPATIMAIAPHAHLLCKSMKSWAITPANDSIPLIDIPQWDFAWQGLYEFRNPIFLPTGTTFYGEATYDNTTANWNNPNDPPEWVFLGEATTDEMMLFYFMYTYGFPIDTNIVIDDTDHAAHYLGCQTEFNIGVEEVANSAAFEVWPNPTHGMVNIEWTGAPAYIRIVDMQGRVVKERRIASGMNVVDLTDMDAGAYRAEVRSAEGQVLGQQKIVVE